MTPASSSNAATGPTGPRLQVPKLPALGWATFLGAKHSSVPCVLDARPLKYTTSGRAAIALALRELGIGAGDSVLVPTYHCPTMVAPVVATGATPVFFPVDGTGGPHLDSLVRCDRTKLRAMIAAHYFGVPQPMAKLRSFCDERGISLIEDCAHALFGVSDDRPVGQWGDFAVASLTKFLPVMDGGCLISKRPLASPSLAISMTDQIKSFANAAEIGARHGRLPGLNGIVSAATRAARSMRISPVKFPPSRDGIPSTDTNKWLSDFSPPSSVNRSASWWTQWTVRHAHRARIVDLRRRNYLALASLVHDIEGVRPLIPLLPENAVPYVFPLFVDAPETIYQHARASGMPLFRWDELWPTCPTIPGDHGLTWASHVFQIGCHQDLRPIDLQHIAEVIRTLVSDGGRDPKEQPFHVRPTARDSRLGRA